MNNNPSVAELASIVAKHAEDLASTMPPLMASLAVLSISDHIIDHLHASRDSIPDETKAVLHLAAAMLVHCSHLFPPDINIDGSRGIKLPDDA